MPDTIKNIHLKLANELNLDQTTSNLSWSKYENLSKNCLLEGDPKEWLCCSLYTACNLSSMPTVGNQMMQGNGISITKLIHVCNVSIIKFFQKMKLWCDLDSVPTSVSHKVELLHRSFSVSHCLYEKFGPIFADLFLTPDFDSNQTGKSNKKAKALPCTPHKLFEFCWCLFVLVKGEYPQHGTDLVASFNLMLCCFDLLFKNAVADKRKDLLNSNFPKDSSGSICIIDQLCERHEAVTVEVLETQSYNWQPVIKKFFQDSVLKGTADTGMKILSLENFDVNFKKINDLYETYILSCGEIDERIFLQHSKNGSKTFGKTTTDPKTSNNSSGSNDALFQNSQLSESVRALVPKTPLSGRNYLNQLGNDLSPIACSRQNVEKMMTILGACKSREPQSSLQELLKHSTIENVQDLLRQRLDEMKIIFEEKYTTNKDRFLAAEALYYRLLENIIYAEVERQGRFDIFVNDDSFNKTLIVLCLEIVLYTFGRTNEFPLVLERFNMEPLNFYKLVELAIRNNKDLFTRHIIKHLNTIEEHCLESLIWRKESMLWDKLNEWKAENGPLPTNQEVDLQAVNGTMTPNTNMKSIKLFFRKFYLLAHLRMKHLVKSLGLNDELLRKIWTMFENSIIEQTDLMKDRHLDQIWMCSIYVLCKIRPEEIPHTFADIMKFYRYQPQAQSHIYRTVYIGSVDDQSDQSDSNGASESGDIISFYNKIYVQRMQSYAMKFASNASQHNLLLSPLPAERPKNSPRKISLNHDVYIQPFTRNNILTPSSKTMTFVIDRSPSRDLQSINSMISQSSKDQVTKRLNIEDGSIKKKYKISNLISDRSEFNKN